jgi:hypothetical protein
MRYTVIGGVPGVEAGRMCALGEQLNVSSTTKLTTRLGGNKYPLLAG